MSDCCSEPNCRRKQPIRLQRSTLTGRWYFLTRWKDRGEGLIEVVEKHAVPDDVQQFLDDALANRARVGEADAASAAPGGSS